MYFRVTMNTLGGTMYIIRQTNQPDNLIPTTEDRVIVTNFYSLSINNTGNQPSLNIQLPGSNLVHSLKLDYKFYTF